MQKPTYLNQRVITHYNTPFILLKLVVKDEDKVERLPQSIYVAHQIIQEEELNYTEQQLLSKYPIKELLDLHTSPIPFRQNRDFLKIEGPWPK